MSPAARPLRAVLFDAGHTLIYSPVSSSDMAGRVLAASGVDVPADLLASAMRRADTHIEDRWHGGDWWHHERAVRELFTAGYRAGLASLEAPHLQPHLHAAVADAIYEAYLEPAHWAVFDDVLPTLEGLRGAGLPLAIVSDWGESLGWLLHHLGLDRHFDAVLVSSRLGLGKPDPGLFAMACRRLGVTPQDGLYVGDTYAKDILGARAAGMPAVLIDRAGRHRGLDCPVIRHLTDLLPIARARRAAPGPATTETST